MAFRSPGLPDRRPKSWSLFIAGAPITRPPPTEGSDWNVSLEPRLELLRFVLQVLGNFSGCLSLSCELVRDQVAERGKGSVVAAPSDRPVISLQLLNCLTQDVATRLQCISFVVGHLRFENPGDSLSPHNARQ